VQINPTLMTAGFWRSDSHAIRRLPTSQTPKIELAYLRTADTVYTQHGHANASTAVLGAAFGVDLGLAPGPCSTRVCTAVSSRAVHIHLLVKLPLLRRFVCVPTPVHILYLRDIVSHRDVPL
jgi:hypothetical protein